ncbi:hypothetical protein LJ739_02075 [Aestuariibacter halophilus]|uniref:DUF2946 domain-containing protein n=1 Tax=Fluctibacter halophilus TaxID=226011 RepID=A0ABS8G3C4_9ALTE|nr:hypothetical protein [Aestuariibacter halophilus]MCC2615028.1 hypothetical protein [Aestuariibacter halophilus]
MRTLFHRLTLVILLLSLVGQVGWSVAGECDMPMTSTQVQSAQSPDNHDDSMMHAGHADMAQMDHDRMQHDNSMSHDCGGCCDTQCHCLDSACSSHGVAIFATFVGVNKLYPERFENLWVAYTGALQTSLYRPPIVA